MSHLHCNITAHHLDTKKKKKSRIGNFFLLGESNGKLKLHYEFKKKIISDLEFYSREEVEQQRHHDVFHSIKKIDRYILLDYSQRRCWIGTNGHNTPMKVDFVSNGGIKSKSFGNERILCLKSLRIENLDMNLYFVLLDSGRLCIFDGQENISEELFLEMWHNYGKGVNTGHFHESESHAMQPLLIMNVSYSQTQGVVCCVTITSIASKSLPDESFLSNYVTVHRLSEYDNHNFFEGGNIKTVCKIVNYQFKIDSFSKNKISPQEYFVILDDKDQVNRHMHPIETRASWTKDGSMLAVAIAWKFNQSRFKQQIMYIDSQFQFAYFPWRKTFMDKLPMLDHEYVHQISWFGYNDCVVIETSHGRWGVLPRFGTDFLRLQIDTIKSNTLIPHSNSASPQELLLFPDNEWKFAIFDGHSIYVHEFQWPSRGSTIQDRATTLYSLFATQLSSLEDELLFYWMYITSYTFEGRAAIQQRECLKEVIKRFVSIITDGNYVTRIVQKFHEVVGSTLLIRSPSNDLIEYSIHILSKSILESCIKKMIDADVCLHFLGSIQKYSGTSDTSIWKEFFTRYPSLKTTNSEKYRMPFNRWMNSIGTSLDFSKETKYLSFHDSFQQNLDINGQNRLFQLCESKNLNENMQPHHLLKNWEMEHLFLENLKNYNLEEAYSIICSQSGFDISIMQELIPTANMLGPLASRLLKGFISLLCLNLQEKSVYLLPSLLSHQSESSKHPLILPHPFLEVEEVNSRNQVYYTPLDANKLRNAVISFVSVNNRSKNMKSLLINAWIASGDLEAAVACCIHFRMWTYLISLNMLHFSKFNHSLLKEILFTSVSKFIEEDKYEYVRKLLMIASVYQPIESNSLRIHIAEQLIDRIRTALKDDTSVMKSRIVPLNFTHLLIEDMTDVNDLYYTSGSPSKPTDVLFKTLHTNDESSSTSRHPFIMLVVDCLNLFSNSSGKLLSLFTLYQSMHESERIQKQIIRNFPHKLKQITPFKQLLQLIWYAHLKSSIIDHVDKLSEFGHVYAPTTKPSEDHDALVATIVHKLILLSRFSDIHTTIDIQGSILTCLSMIRSAQIIKDLLLSVFPTEESVIPTLRYKLDQIYLKVEHMNPKIYESLLTELRDNSEDILNLTLVENSTEYWNYMDNLFHLLTSDEMFTMSRSDKILQFATMTEETQMMNKELKPDIELEPELSADPQLPKSTKIEDDSNWIVGDSITRNYTGVTVSPPKVMMSTYESIDLDEPTPQEKSYSNTVNNPPRLFQLQPMNRSAILQKYGKKKNQHVTFSNEPKIFNIAPRRRHSQFSRLEDFIGEKEKDKQDKVRLFRIPLPHAQPVPTFVKSNKEVIESRKSLSPQRDNQNTDRQRIVFARPHESLIERFNESLEKKSRSSSKREKKRVTAWKDEGAYDETPKKPLTINHTSAQQTEVDTSQVEKSNNLPTKELIEQMFEKMTKQLTNEIDQKIKNISNEEKRSIPKVAPILLDNDDDDYMKKKTKGKISTTIKPTLNDTVKPLNVNNQKAKQKTKQKDLSVEYNELNPPAPISKKSTTEISPRRTKMQATEEKKSEHEDFRIYEAHHPRYKSPISTVLSEVSNDDPEEIQDDTTFSEYNSEVKSDDDSPENADAISTLSSLSLSRFRFSSDAKEERYREHLRALGHEPALRKISRLLPVVSEFDKLKQEVLNSPGKWLQNQTFNNNSFYKVTGNNGRNIGGHEENFNNNNTSMSRGGINPSMNMETNAPYGKSARVFHPGDMKEQTLRNKLDTFLQSKRIPKSPPKLHLPMPIHEIPDDDLNYEIHSDIKKILNRGDDLLDEFSALQKEMEEAQSLINNINF